jgi:hypothetical protein
MVWVGVRLERNPVIYYFYKLMSCKGKFRIPLKADLCQNDPFSVEIEGILKSELQKSFLP